MSMLSEYAYDYIEERMKYLKLNYRERVLYDRAIELKKVKERAIIVKIAIALIIGIAAALITIIIK